MDFAVLGPLRVVGDDGAIEIRAAKQRSLLATLLLSHREAAVSAERLVDVLWGEEPPQTAVKALQVYVSNLRRALGPAGARIVTRPGGYAIELAAGELDVERLETLVAAAAGARRRGDLDAAAAGLREALALFRGAPLGDAPLLGPAAAEADRLAEARVAALEELMDVELARGRHAAVAGELEALTGAHPYRERLHGQLMLALYRSGRQADALDAYRRTRERLVEDLGLDPGRELQRLEAAILGQDPALDLAAAPAPAPAPVAPPELPALPVPPTPLLGREDDLATAAALLAQPHVRLLTLTGPAGIGKTRLALELAHRTAGVFAHGAVLVPLAAVGDPARVPAEIGEALGAPDGDLTAALARRELLLVIDNFEHLLAAAPDLGALLATSPGSKLVVTSRAALRLAGEHELAVPPLPAAASAELFLGRARALDPRLALSAEDRESVERICARLDGLPLAIELAAARTKVLSPPAILSRLERRLDLLSAGPRDAPARQQTLRAAIGWSCDLLDPEAQALFARVGVFVGGWTLETAEAVCGPHALDGIAALVDHSLVTRTDGRFGMLETVRELALERLAESGELPAVRRRHAEALLERFAGAESGVLTGAQRGWLDGLDADRENVRAAIAFAVAEGDAALALGLCAAAWRYWERRGHVAEGRATLESGLALPGGPDSARMVAHNGAGVLAGEQADLPGARAHFEAALELAQALGDGARAARIGGNLGSIALYERDYPEAIRRYTEAMERAEDPRSRSLWLQNAGLAHEASGDRARGLELVRESIGLAREAGDPSHLSSTLRTLARLELHDDAAELDGPLALVHESLELSRQLSERHALAELLETLGGIARRRGDPRTGAVLIAAAAASRGAAGAIRAPDEDPWVQREEAALRAALGGEAYAAAVADGARLTLAEATTLSEEV